MAVYGKNKKRKKRGLIVVLILVFALLLGWIFIAVNVSPVIRTVSSEAVKALTTDAVNNAAADVMNSNAAYSELMSVSKDNEGKITLIQANTVLINMLARNTTIEAQKNIAKMGEQGIKIPVGSLSGLAMLAGRGPEMTIKVLPVGSIISGFNSKFTAAGINQTKHRIYMTLDSSVSVIIPGMNTSISTSTEVLISECIIVGEVPEFYLNSEKISDILDLVP